VQFVNIFNNLVLSTTILSLPQQSMITTWIFLRVRFVYPVTMEMKTSSGAHVSHERTVKSDV